VSAGFRKRLLYYEQAYVPIDDDSLSYIKFFSPGQRLIVNRMEGSLCVFVFHVITVIFSRVCAVQDNIIPQQPQPCAVSSSHISAWRKPFQLGWTYRRGLGCVSFDLLYFFLILWSGLSERGQQYGEALGEFIAERKPSLDGLKVPLDLGVHGLI
jgi:hypothetical protein